MKLTEVILGIEVRELDDGMYKAEWNDYTTNTRYAEQSRSKHRAVAYVLEEIAKKLIQDSRK